MQKYRLFIGIDISKKTIDVSLTLNGKKEQMLHVRLQNNLQGFRSMMQFIKKAKTGIPQNEWFFSMEHTGVYTLLLSNFLQKRKLAYTLISGHHLAKSLGLRRGKNDKADSKDIARFSYVFRDELKSYTLPSDKLLTIKGLLSLRSRLVNANKGLATASNELKSFAKKAVYQQIVKHSKDTIERNKQTIAKIETQIGALIQQEDELQRLYDLIISVKGVGPIISANLLVFTNGFKSFNNAKEFACYIGIVPFEKSSGTSVYTPGKVSHLAHKKLKGIISNGASAAMLYDKELRAYYERKILEGKNKFVVRNAVTNKFIHRIFAVVKRGSVYVELHRFKA